MSKTIKSKRQITAAIPGMSIQKCRQYLANSRAEYQKQTPEQPLTLCRELNSYLCIEQFATLYKLGQQEKRQAKTQKTKITKK